MKSMIKTHLRDAIAAKEHLLENQMPLIEEIGLSMLEAVKKGKKIIE